MFSKKIFKFFVFIVFLLVARFDLKAQTNDHIFPASNIAKKYIDFDSKGFIINGKRTFLASAGLEYARIPHQLWHDRLLRLKRDGFNCIEIYTFWNFHEPVEGKFDFEGDHDLNRFLREVNDLGMYAIVRVGPYYCGEWDLGGYPHWLRYKKGLLVRQPNALFEKYVDRFFDRLLPIVAKNQINHGGSVVMVQLENEHPASWGTYIPNEYFSHLKNKALSLGIEVPYFFSGLHHGNDPAGNAQNLDDSTRPNPWFTTEFWSVWYNRYGSNQADADLYGRRTWKIIAHGGNGYNYYMAHGGTNFGYTNGHEVAACYDYGAAVGQTGDLRPIYYQFKRNALFARSFEEILENSNGIAGPANFVTDNRIKVNTRHSKAGDIIFLDNPTKNFLEAKINLGEQYQSTSHNLTLAPGEIVPVVHNFALSKNVKIEWAASRMLGIQQELSTKTIVLYGAPNSNGYLSFRLNKGTSIEATDTHFKYGKGLLELSFQFDSKIPQSYTFKIGEENYRIVTLSTQLSDHTWFIDTPGNYVVVGPQYLGKLSKTGESLSFETERFGDRADVVDSIWTYGEGKFRTAKNHSAAVTTYDGLKWLGPWQTKSASEAALVDLDDSKWLASEYPLEMGADGDLSENTWYRTKFKVPVSGLYKLDINRGGNRFMVFIDNKKVASGDLNSLEFNIAAGPHVMAVYVAHDGRDKLFGFTGALDKVDVKGMEGKVILRSGRSQYLRNWKMIRATDSSALEGPLPNFDAAKDYIVGKDAFHGKEGYAWFRSVISNDKGHPPISVHFGSIDEEATIFINKKEVGKVAMWNQPITVSIPTPISGQDSSIITVFVHNRSGAGGIDKPVELLFDKGIDLKGWKMKGGPGDFQNPNGWTTLNISDSSDRPSFYKNYFELPSENTDQYPIWRVSLSGLNHGFIWVNGHNLGAYPERVPINSLYIPECWLKKGRNEIVVYDEYGARPDSIKILTEMASTRTINEVKVEEK